MTPQFAKAVDPVFLCVLGLLERIENGERVDPEEARAAIRKALDDVEAAGVGESREWELARYALVAWTDEVLIDAGGPVGSRFHEVPLEFELFQSSKREVAFFTKAKDARELAGRDALEVFYLCVVLGFRGLYRKPASVEKAPSLGLPADLETWARHTAQAIRYGQNRGQLVDRPTEALRAPPLTSHSPLLWSFVAFGALAILLIVVLLSGVGPSS
jgi:type VI secretion system protein ImpK